MRKLFYFIIIVILFFWIIKTEVISQESEYMIRLNEVMPNPEGSDTDYEWVEIYNYSDRSIDISTCSIDERTFPEGTILNSRDYLIVTRDILDKDDDGKSFEQRWGNGSGIWGDHISESYTVVELSISMSNSNDRIGLTCPDFYNEFSWSSAISGQSYSFSEDEEWVDEYDITPGGSNAAIPVPNYSHEILITEIYPSPDSKLAENEWLELYNFGDSDVNLDGWILKDNTKSMTLSDGVIISKGLYLVFDSDYLNFTLNNSGERISLFDPSEEIVDIFEYAETDKGISNIRKYQDGIYGNDVFQTQVASYGKENVYIDPNDVFYGKERMDIAEARNLDIGEFVLIEGSVSVELGILGEKVFYVQDQSGGIQIYLKDTEFWYEYRMFDSLQIYGELKETYGERKIYIDNENSIRKVETEEEISVEELDVCDIDFEIVGRLVFLTGMITQTSGKTFYIGGDDCEIKVLIKESTGIETPDKKKGQYAGIVGIISRYGSSEDSIRILPRYASDIVISDDPVEFGDVLAATGSDIRGLLISGLLMAIISMFFILKHDLICLDQRSL